jgi:hypothetical protein
MKRKRNPGTKECDLDGCPRFVEGTTNCEAQRMAYKCSHWCWVKGFNCDVPLMGAD